MFRMQFIGKIILVFTICDISLVIYLLYGLYIMVSFSSALHCAGKELVI